MSCKSPAEVVCYLAILLGRPIKWIENRQENMTAFRGRRHSAEAEAAVESDVTILAIPAIPAIKDSIVANLGAYYFLSTPQRLNADRAGLDQLPADGPLPYPARFCVIDPSFDGPLLESLAGLRMGADILCCPAIPV